MVMPVVKIDEIDDRMPGQDAIDQVAADAAEEQPEHQPAHRQVAQQRMATPDKSASAASENTIRNGCQPESIPQAAPLLRM